MRVGEAQNPGPICNTAFMPDHIALPDNVINIGVVNPTGLIFKQDEITTLGPGIWSVAESRVTQKGQQTLRRELKQAKLNVEFSKPVPTLGKNLGNYYQGIASGVACITQYPMRKTLFDIPQSIHNTSRFLATHVSLGPHSHLLIVTIYAPTPSSHTIQNPQSLTDDLLHCANRVVKAWQGPAIIQGDFNQDIAANADIAELFQAGWVDAHDVSVQCHGHSKKPTCITPNGGISHNTKILCNPIVANSIVYCNAWDDHLFATHPTLVLTCRLPAISQPHAVWKLPKPFSCHSFDHECAENTTPDTRLQKLFDDAVANRDVQLAAEAWTQQTERTLAGAARDKDGKNIIFPQSHFGRHKGPKMINSPIANPILRPARYDEPNLNQVQGSMKLRQHLRQYRRLHTMVGLCRARDKHPTTANSQACKDLWKAICGATGFGKHGFPKWFCDHFAIPFHLELPELDTVVCVRDTFGKYFQEFSQSAKDEHKKITDSKYQHDWDNGGALTFAALRECGPAPCCYVGKTVQTVVKKVKWSKQGLTKIPCQDLTNFQLNAQVVFQGQTSTVMHINLENNVLQVDKPLYLRTQHFGISQKICIFDNQKATDEVTQQWNQFLQRDVHRTSQDWDEADRIAAEIPQQTVMEIPSFEPELWRRVQRSTNIRSARGSCGYTIAETRAFPTWILLLLFRLYELIETTAQWPDSWLCAFVTMLPKSSQPGSALDFRPITIMSRLYRQWARYKSIAIIVQLSQKIPNLIGGGTKNMSSLLLNAHFQETLEDNPQHEVCGLTVDIMKCYNCVPRYPLMAFMAKMGWPINVIRTYLSALVNLRRSFMVLGHCSQWQKSYTGIPEGCALAVASMLTINAALYFFLQNRVPTTILYTFADNWSLKFFGIARAFESAKAIEIFCAALALQLSVPKSWTWATTQRVAAQLYNLKLQNVQVPNIKHVKDLGVDTTYRGKRKKDHLKHRLQLGLTRCTKLQKSSIPKKRCSKLLLTSCFPKAAYGVELSELNNGTFKDFRTNVKKSLGFQKQGSSPWITLSLMGRNVDFEHYTIVRTILFWRKYIQTFKHREYDIFRKISSKPKGVLAGIVACFNKLGNVTPLGLWNTPHFGIVNWLTVSKKWLKYIITYEWKAHVCQQVQNRPNFLAGMVDTDGFGKNLLRFDDEERRIIQSHTGGTHYTRDAQSHFDSVTTDVCPFCKNERDSRTHRILTCPILAPCRSHFKQETWRELRNNPTLCHFGIIPIQPDDFHFRKQFCVPWPILQVKFPGIMHVFTDGSCYHNEFRRYAIGGSAAIFYDVIDQVDPTYQFRTILPTSEHSSYRAEIYATYIAVKICAKPIIYTDCQAVIDGWNLILDALRNHKQLPVLDHIDLWGPIVDCISDCYNEVRIIKIKAHTEGQDWFSRANSVADVEAKRSITVDNPEKLFSATNKVKRTLQLRNIQYQVMFFQVQAAFFEFKHNQEHSDEALRTRMRPVMTVPCEPLRRQIFDLDGAECIYGSVFLHRVAQWASTLFWETEPNHSTSYFELMLQFIYTTGTLPPFPMAKYPERPSNKQKCWVLKDQNPTYDFQGFTCQDILTSFIRTVKWAKRNIQVDLFPDGVQMQVNSLHIFHYKGFTGGVCFRAQLPDAEKISAYCEQHLPYRKNLRIPIPHVSSRN